MDPRRSPDLPPRHQRDLLRVCGLAAVTALFERDPGRVERLLFEPRLRVPLARYCAVLASTHKPYRELSAADLARAAGTVLHGGVVAIARPRPVAVFDPAAIAGWARRGRPILVLDGVGNPHNLGAIARTAAFFGLEHLLLASRPEQAMPSDASYRVAEGGLDHLTLWRAPMPRALDELRPYFRIVGSVAGEGISLAEFRSERPAAVVLGNEEAGIDAATLNRCDDLVTIAGGGRIQSLNVAAAAAIMLFALDANRRC